MTREPVVRSGDMVDQTIFSLLIDEGWLAQMGPEAKHQWFWTPFALQQHHEARKAIDTRLRGNPAGKRGINLVRNALMRQKLTAPPMPLTPIAAGELQPPLVEKGHATADSTRHIFVQLPQEATLTITITEQDFVRAMGKEPAEDTIQLSAFADLVAEVCAEHTRTNWDNLIEAAGDRLKQSLGWLSDVKETKEQTNE